MSYVDIEKMNLYIETTLAKLDQRGIAGIRN